jgi:hypothetical protein
VDHFHWTKEWNKQEIWPWLQQIKLTDASSVVELTCGIKFHHWMPSETALVANFGLHRATLALLLWSLPTQICSETADLKMELKSVDKNRSVIAPGQWK